MMGRYIVLFLFAFLVDGMFGGTDEVMTVKEGDPFILNTGVTKDENDRVKWYFNDTLLAQINGHPSSSCIFDGRFRSRLEVDYKTGSLNIIEITVEHNGRYEAEYIRETPGKTQSLNRPPTCNSTKIIQKSRILGNITKTFNLNVIAPDKNKKEDVIPQDKKTEENSADVTGIVVPVVLVAVALVVVIVSVIYCRKKRNGIQGCQQSSEEKIMIDASHMP